MWYALRRCVDKHVGMLLIRSTAAPLHSTALSLFSSVYKQSPSVPTGRIHTDTQTTRRGDWFNYWTYTGSGSFATKSVRRTLWVNRPDSRMKNEPTWFHVSVLSCSSLSFVLPDSTPTRWLTVHCVKLAEWWRGTGLGNNPIPNMKCSSAERNFVLYVVCWLMTVCTIVWERGRSWVWLTQLRTVHSMIHCYQKRDWTNERTNDSERLFLANWPTQTESRKIIIK